MTDATEVTAQIEAILGAATSDQRRVLQAIRETIAAACPSAVETISYSMPAFRYHGKPLVGYMPFKRHCSLFPMGAEIIDRYPEDFAPFRTAKGTLQFSPDAPIPDDLVLNARDEVTMMCNKK